MKATPKTEEELMQHAAGLEGKSLAGLADLYGIQLPERLLHAKGLIGQLLEQALGTTAGTLAEPDFQALGIELKTIPLDRQGRPLETTYVCHVQLLGFTGVTWETSLVWKKLKRVLWIPVEAERSIPIGERRIGKPILWTPTFEQEQILRNDWEELVEMITIGELEKITARLGTYLQIRPKAANSKSLCWGIDSEGNKIQTLPRGFYLRTQFTRKILQSTV